MKHFLIFLISLGFIAGLVACTPTVVPEVAYVAVPTMPTQDMAVPPPALVFVTAHPTRVVSTATAVPTETAAATATAVPPTMPARETPTNVAVTPSTAISIGVSPISPTIELTRAVVITATVPTTNTLPNAQTPTPGWHYYVSDPHGLMMQIPAHWLLSPDFMYRLEGSDGFVELLATNSQDNVLLNAC